MASVRQALPAQKALATQSASEAQVVLHAPAEQTKPPGHTCGAGDAQAPALHVP
jgi:hypothetical protein